MDSENLENFLFSMNEEGGDIFHHAADDHFDDKFIYFVNRIKSDPMKMKTLLLQKDANGDIPFHVIVKNRQLRIIKAILDTNAGSEISDSLYMSENNEGANIFHHAADDFCNDDVFILLLDFIGSDTMKIKTFLLKKDNDGCTPFDLVVKKRLLNKLKAVLNTNAGSEILEHAIVNENAEGRNIFHHAADIYRNDGMLIHLVHFVKSDLTKVKNLLLKKDVNGDTPVDLVIKRRQLNILKAILDTSEGPEILDSVVSSENTKGRNIFHCVAEDYGNDDMFIHLMDFVKKDTMKMNTVLLKRDINGDTPLDLIVKEGHVNMLKAVLDTTESPEILDKVLSNENAESRNLFYYAADDYDNENVFICLLNFTSSDSVKLKTLLLKKDIYHDTPLDVIVKKRLLNKLKAVLNTSLGLEILDSVSVDENEGRNVFHHAADAYCNDGMLIYLLDFMKSEPAKLKTYLHKEDVNGDTPFDVVVKNGQVNVMKAALDSSVGLAILKNALANENLQDRKIFHNAVNGHYDNDVLVYLGKFFGISLHKTLINT